MSEAASAPGPGHGTTLRLLHWIVAVFVVATLPAGLVMTMEATPGWLSGALFLFHKNGGAILFAVMTLRLVARWVAPPPPLPASVPVWQRRAAAANHVALYVLLFFMIVTGYLRTVAGGYPVEILDAVGVPALVPETARLEAVGLWLHAVGKWAIGALVLLHVAAALYHGALRRDGVVARIWPPVAPPRG